MQTRVSYGTVGAVLLASRLAFGGGEALVAVAGSQSLPVAAALRRPADFVALPVTLAGAGSERVAFDDVRQAIERLRAEAAAAGGLLRIRLNPDSGTAKTSGGIASPHVHVLAPLRGGTNDVLAAAGDLQRFLASVRLSPQVRAIAGPVQLAVERPEQYRPQLLTLVADEIARTKAGLGRPAGVRVDGLQGRVLVRQADEANVDLYIDYRITVQSRASSWRQPVSSIAEAVWW